jgi:hypothetical protein
MVAVAFLHFLCLIVRHMLTQFTTLSSVSETSKAKRAFRRIMNGSRLMNDRHSSPKSFENV